MIRNKGCQIEQHGQVVVVNFTDFLNVKQPSSNYEPSLAKACFATRKGGFSKAPYNALNVSTSTGDNAQDVLMNIELLFSAMGAPCRWLYAQQVHGDRVYIDPGPNSAISSSGLVCDLGPIGEFDAIVTKYKDVTISTFHADCYPIMARCNSSGVIGVAHAGWKGVYLEIAKAMLDAMVVEGASPEAIRLAVGPGIGVGAYEVNAALAQQFESKFGSAVVPKNIKQDRVHLDLLACLEKTLLDWGLQPDQIAMASLCTSSEKELFYSHRRDGQQTGRMMSMVFCK